MTSVAGRTTQADQSQSDYAVTAIGSRARDYWALMKPRVMSLVVFTGWVGLVAAPGALDPVVAIVTLSLMAAGAGACGALNMWYDADIDAIMQRTQRRPIPRGRVTGSQAYIIGTLMSVASVGALGVYVNWLSAFLLAFTIVFYVFIYTMGLKRRTPQNIVIGGVAGSLPPMIGWAAASGTLDAGAMALFLIIFLWTPPHFWALAIARSGDYEKAGVPMMPVVAGPESTARQILAYSVLLAASSFLPVAIGTSSMLYAAAATLLNAVLLWRAFQLWQAAGDAHKRPKAAMRLFGYSILYLFALYLALLLGAL